MTGLKGRGPEGILPGWEKCDSKKKKTTLQRPYYTIKAHQDRRSMWPVVTSMVQRRNQTEMKVT